MLFSPEAVCSLDEDGDFSAEPTPTISSSRTRMPTPAGIEATDVVQRNGVLVFSGEFYLDEQGLPTAKSTAVFNMFKYLAHELSDKYHLAD